VSCFTTDPRTRAHERARAHASTPAAQMVGSARSSAAGPAPRPHLVFVRAAAAQHTAGHLASAGAPPDVASSRSAAQLLTARGQSGRKACTAGSNSTANLSAARARVAAPARRHSARAH
jgi:hypothetical protein